MARRRQPRQAIYRDGKWVDVRGDEVNQNAAWAAWRRSRPPGPRKYEKPHEHSVVTVRDWQVQPSAAPISRQTRQHISNREFAKEYEKASLVPVVHGKPARGYVKRGKKYYRRRELSPTEYLSRVGSDIANIAVNAPAGIAAAGEHPLRTAKQAPGQFWYDLQHAQEHPGNFFLDALSVASLGGGAGVRAASVGRAARTGGVRAAARAAVTPHRPGTYPVTLGERTEQIPLSRSHMYRPIQRERLRRKQVALDAGAASPSAFGPVGRWIQDQTTAAATVGRARRARWSVTQAERKSLQAEQGAAIRGLSKGEKAAINVIASAGHEGMRDPLAAVTAQIKNHLDAARDWERRADEATSASIRKNAERQARQNKRYAARLQEALPTLRNPTPEWHRALETTRRGSEHMQAEKIERGYLTEETAQGRIASQAAAAVGELDQTSLGMKTELQEVEARIRMLEGLAKAKHLPDRADIQKYTEQSALGKLYRRRNEIRAEIAATPEQVKIAPPGAFYYSTASKHTEGPQPKTPGVRYDPRQSPYGYASTTTPGRHGVTGLRKQFRGGSFKRELPMATDVVNHQLGAWAKFTVADDMLGELWDYGSGTRQSARQVPVRNTPEVKAELKAILKDLEDAADENALQKAERKLRDLFRREEDEARTRVDVGVDTEGEGIRWVDPAVIKNLTGDYGPLLKIFDAVNAPARFGHLYTRPAYILNLAGNIGMGAIEQGMIRYARSFAKARNAKEWMGPEDYAKSLSLMGESKSLAYASEKGPLAKVNRAAADAWNRVTDKDHRVAMLIAEAEREGFKTPLQYKKFLNDESLEAKRVEVVQRARDGAVNFDSLTPFERDVMRRLIYFYPWISRGSTWAVRATLDHPMKTLVGVQLGEVGTEKIMEAFGNLGPTWQRLAGLIPVGKRENGFQRVLNPSSVWTPTTAVQAGQTVADLARGLAGQPNRGTFGDASTPFLELYSSTLGGEHGGGVMSLLESQPIYQLGVRAGLYDKPSKTYPEEGVGPSLLPWAAGGFAPRKLKVAEREKQALREAPRDVRVTVSARKAVAREQQETYAKALDAGVIDKGERLPKVLRDAYALRRQERVATAELNHLDPAYQFEAFKIDAMLLVKMGVASRKEALAAIEEWRGAPKEEIQSERNRLKRLYFGGKVIEQAHEEIRDAAHAAG